MQVLNKVRFLGCQNLKRNENKEVKNKEQSINTKNETMTHFTSEQWHAQMGIHKKKDKVSFGNGIDTIKLIGKGVKGYYEVMGALDRLNFRKEVYEFFQQLKQATIPAHRVSMDHLFTVSPSIIVPKSIPREFENNLVEVVGALSKVKTPRGGVSHGFTEGIMSFDLPMDANIRDLKNKALKKLYYINENYGDIDAKMQVKKDLIRNLFHEDGLHEYSLTSAFFEKVPYSDVKNESDSHGRRAVQHFHRGLPDRYYKEFKKELIREGLYSPQIKNNPVSSYMYYDLLETYDDSVYGEFKREILSKPRVTYEGRFRDDCTVM